MFQSAYRQISQPERSFVDRLVDALAEAARRTGRSIRLALSGPLPPSIMALDKRGWLERPLVRAAITERVTARADADEITAERWIREVSAIAHFDLTDYFTVDEVGDPLFDIEALREAERSGAIKSIEVEKSDGLTRSTKTKIKIQAHDKMAALKMEAAYLGLDDGDNPYRRADKEAQATAALSEGTTAQEAGDAYARLIGDS